MLEAQTASTRWRVDAGPLAFVWGIWLILSLYLIHYVNTYGVDLPAGDEWEIIPALTGHQPITWKWLWSQHNEHRIVIPRLVYLAVERLARCDFRAGAYFNSCVLSASAAAMIAVARRLRGHTSYSDAFFPMVTLHWGQAENLLSSFHVQWLVAAGLVTTALLILVQSRRLAFRSAVALGLCTLSLPLCGGNGLAFVPALAVCVFLAGWHLRRLPPWRGWASACVWALGATSLALTKLYFVDYSRPAKHPVSQYKSAALQGAVRFLVVGLGSATRSTWPNVKYALLAAFAALSVALLFTWIWRREERSRVFRLLLFFGGVFSLAVGIGWARTALSVDFTFNSRYATPAAAFWCASYFGWEFVKYGPLRRFAQMCLLLMAGVFLVANRNDGMALGATSRDQRQLVVKDIRDGTPLDEIVARHSTRIYYGEALAVAKDSPAGPEVLKARMRMLKERGIGVFKELKE